MAIAFGAFDNQINDATVSSYSKNHTIGSGVSMLLVRLAIRGDVSSPSGVTVTCGGVAMTAAVERTNTTGRQYAGIFYLMNPSAGVKAIAVSWTNAGTSAISMVDCSGVDPAISAHSTASNTTGSSTISVTCTGITIGDLVVDLAVDGSGAVWNSTGQNVENYAQMETTAADPLTTRGSSLVADATSETMAWSLTTAGNGAMAACAFTPAPVSVGTKFRRNLDGIERTGKRGIL